MKRQPCMKKLTRYRIWIYMITFTQTSGCRTYPGHLKSMHEPMFPLMNIEETHPDHAPPHICAHSAHGVGSRLSSCAHRAPHVGSPRHLHGQPPRRRGTDSHRWRASYRTVSLLCPPRYTRRSPSARFAGDRKGVRGARGGSHDS